MTVRQEVVAAAGRAVEGGNRCEHPDCNSQNKLEVSIAYSIALMAYFINSTHNTED
jgi:hypothetical protein